MTSPFDPYHRWLGIPPKDQPPNHYRILGLEPFESDLDVIAAAADRQMAYVRLCAAGEQLDNSQKILGELANAPLSLLNAEQKRQYDIALRAQLPSVDPTVHQPQAERDIGPFPPGRRLPSSAVLATALLIIVVITWAATRPSPKRDAPIAADRSMTTKPAQDAIGLEQSKELDAATVPPNSVSDPASAEWIRDVAALPAEEQVKEVAGKMQELNPGFDGKLNVIVENGAITSVEFMTTRVKDVSPLRAFSKVRSVSCQHPDGLAMKFSDLAPLRGLPLESLYCPLTEVSDLSPLKGMSLKNVHVAHSLVNDLLPLVGMPMRELYMNSTQVADLSPLKGMSLEYIDLSHTAVSDITPLKGMPIRDLRLQHTNVSDLSPVMGMALTILFCDQTRVADLSPLKGMPLKILACDFKADRDAELLRSIGSLERINGKTAAEFWKDIEKTGR